ncbi:DUF4118 domain-containing protein [Ideonella sp. B508-1]|uniref:DUF4118 domain-containing protein n=1 Tax=Ideonella sp. B508-1 TaxID=137716 RepID=UPI001F3CF31F|nr:DUF4118 domain-containing protein [Ideonella sp. B508-1]
MDDSPEAEKLLRRCARLATQLDLPWHALHVETPASARRPEAQRRRLERSLKLAQDLGAEVATLPAAELAPALVRYARKHNLSRLVIGRRPRHGWRAWRPWGRPLAEQVAALAEDLDLLQVALPAPRDTGGPPPRGGQPAVAAPDWRGHGAALAACALTALLCTPLRPWLELSNTVMLFLLVVVGVALRYGRSPAVLAAFTTAGR